VVERHITACDVAHVRHCRAAWSSVCADEAVSHERQGRPSRRQRSTCSRPTVESAAVAAVTQLPRNCHDGFNRRVDAVIVNDGGAISASLASAHISLQTTT